MKLDIRDEVYRVIRDLLGDDEFSISDTDDLVKDLHITSDDLSYVFIIGISNKFNLKIPNEEWNNVSTVGECIELFSKYSS